MHFYLVTTYKHEAYFPAMLESLRKQYDTLSDFRRHARVLVVDDCSPDGTAQVLKDAESKHPNVEVFVNPVNRGIGFNRNFLLNWLCSRSPSPDDFVLFVDGDDLLPEGSVVRKVEAFRGEPDLQVVGGQLGVFYGNDVANVAHVNTFPVDPQVQAIANIFECHFYVSNALFRASVFLDGAVRFPETPTSEDWLFFTLHQLRQRHIPDISLFYRRHDHNLTTAPIDGGLVFGLRRQARALSLLRMGMFPSVRDIELLDMVGYLSFRMRWFADQMAPQPQVYMPWFQLLGKRPDIRAEWPSLRAELRGLFDRMLAHNNRVPGFPQGKLSAYLEAILRMADQEVAAVLSLQTA